MTLKLFRRPVPVTASQWLGHDHAGYDGPAIENWRDHLEWAGDEEFMVALNEEARQAGRYTGDFGVLVAADGFLLVEPGDWVVTDEKSVNVYADPEFQAMFTMGVRVQVERALQQDTQILYAVEVWAVGVDELEARTEYDLESFEDIDMVPRKPLNRAEVETMSQEGWRIELGPEEGETRSYDANGVLRIHSKPKRPLAVIRDEHGTVRIISGIWEDGEVANLPPAAPESRSIVLARDANGVVRQRLILP